MSNDTTKKKAPEPISTIAVAPKRSGFSIADFRTALKQAEQVQEPSRVKLLDYYNDILLDMHLSAVIDKRLDKISATKFRFTDKKGTENDAVNKLMDTVFFREMLRDALSSKFFGATALWIDLSGVEFTHYEKIPNKHYIPQIGSVVKKVSDKTGIDLSSGKYPLYTIMVGNSNDLGLLLKAIPWVLMKRGDISDWATFNELFAFPFRVAKYPQYDEVARDALADACRDAASMGFAIIPDTTNFEFVNAQANSSTDAFERFGSFCDKQISKGFVRNTMTLDAEGGQYKGDVHQQSEDSVYASDRQFSENFLNGDFLKLLDVHGFNPGDGKFSAVEEDHICLTDRITIDEKLSKIIEMPAEYFYKKYGIPIPRGGAKLLSQAPTGASKLVGELSHRVSELQELIDNQPIATKTAKRGFFD